MKSLMKENGIVCDEDGTPMMQGYVRMYSKAGKTLGRIRSSRIKRNNSISYSPSPFKPLEDVADEIADREFNFAPNLNWWAEPEYAEDYLAVFIRDAKGLAIRELHHMSSSTHVRIR